MLDKKISIGNVVISAILVFLLCIIGFQAIKIKRLESGISGLIPGESLPELSLIDLNNKEIKTSEFSEGVTIICCFKVPCISCNSNLTLWKKIFQYFGEKIRVIGIFPDEDPLNSQLKEEKHVEFPLYLPGDVLSFKKKMRLRDNAEITIISHNDRVVDVKIGTLSAEDLNTLVDKIKFLVKKS